jgi:hypothetical protein
MKGIDMKEIHRWALRAIVGVSKAALFCLGLLAMCALVVVATVLTAVMLAATILPATAGRQKRDLEQRHPQKGFRGHRHQMRSGDKLLTQ